MREIEYDRTAAVQYALRWALARNPAYYDYADIGGDCTSFASQCVYAGSGVMNYTPTFGWYYISANDKSPSWSGVEFFYNFMTTNEGVGPFAQDVLLSELLPGDIIQLGNASSFYHTLVLTMIKSIRGRLNYYICAHNNDAFQRNLNTYSYSRIRCLHILGVRTE
ncbi:MAG: amidase domain-containing protein [Clostridia bacterium]|nr:amidase domain-containing protein [Clostridia bacterium]